MGKEKLTNETVLLRKKFGAKLREFDQNNSDLQDRLIEKNMLIIDLQDMVLSLQDEIKSLRKF